MKEVPVKLLKWEWERNGSSLFFVHSFGFSSLCTTACNSDLIPRMVVHPSKWYFASLKKTPVNNISLQSSYIEGLDGSEENPWL